MNEKNKRFKQFAAKVCDDSQLRNTVDERYAFAQGWRTWVARNDVGDCKNVVEMAGWRFAAFVAELTGVRPRMSDAYDAALEFLTNAPGCDTCDGTGRVHHAGITTTCPVCRTSPSSVVPASLRGAHVLA